MKEHILYAIFNIKSEEKSKAYTNLLSFLQNTEKVNQRTMKLVTYHSPLKGIRELPGEMDDYRAGAGKTQDKPGMRPYSLK